MAQKKTPQQNYDAWYSQAKKDAKPKASNDIKVNLTPQQRQRLNKGKSRLA